MGRAALRAKLAGREMLPKDAFEPMGVIVGGGDSSLFRTRIKETWGRYPLEMFVSTEALLVACQAWDCTSLTFVPTLNFLEFIPEDNSVSNPEDVRTPVRTALLDELVGAVVEDREEGAQCGFAREHARDQITPDPDTMIGCFASCSAATSASTWRWSPDGRDSTSGRPA